LTTTYNGKVQLQEKRLVSKCAVFSFLFSKFQLKQQRKGMRGGGSTAADVDVVYPDPNNPYKCISYGQIFLYDKSVSNVIFWSLAQIFAKKYLRQKKTPRFI
jgi:hypothetical protein